MKTIIRILSAIFVCLIFYHCSTSKNLEYNLYEGLRPEDESSLKASLNAGASLYKIHCADCHGIFNRGKKDIPDFSKEELHDYKDDFLEGEVENHAIMDEMSETELDQVILFLKLVKRQ